MSMLLVSDICSSSRSSATESFLYTVPYVATVLPSKLRSRTHGPHLQVLSVPSQPHLQRCTSSATRQLDTQVYRYASSSRISINTVQRMVRPIIARNEHFTPDYLNLSIVYSYYLYIYCITHSHHWFPIDDNYNSLLSTESLNSCKNERVIHICKFSKSKKKFRSISMTNIDFSNQLWNLRSGEGLQRRFPGDHSPFNKG